MYEMNFKDYNKLNLSRDSHHKYDIYSEMLLIHKFEDLCYDLVRLNKIKSFTYLSAGQESIPVGVYTALIGTEVVSFAQHRNHHIYIASGGTPRNILKQLTGSTLGGDPCLSRYKLIGHIGLIADHVPIATGYSFRSPVVCFMGDGAVEEDQFYPAIGYAATHCLPILYVVEDNNLSVLTEVKDRRNWDICKVAEGFGLFAQDMVDDPWTIHYWVNRWATNGFFPTLLNIRTCRKYWHVITPNSYGKMEQEWDRLQIVEDEVKNYVDIGYIKYTVENYIQKLAENICLTYPH